MPTIGGQRDGGASWWADMESGQSWKAVNVGVKSCVALICCGKISHYDEPVRVANQGDRWAGTWTSLDEDSSSATAEL